MPAFPKFNDVGRLVGRIEVHRQFHAKHMSNAPPHIAIAAEIEVQLQRIKQHYQPGIRAGQPCHISIACIHRLAEGIRKQHRFLTAPAQTDTVRLQTFPNPGAADRFADTAAAFPAH